MTKRNKIINTVVLVPVISFGTWGILSCGGIGIFCGIIFVLASIVALTKIWQMPDKPKVRN